MKARSLHDKAHKWLRDNPEEIKRYAGLWVVVTGSGVSMSDEDREKLYRRSSTAGNLNPLIIGVAGFREP